MNSSSNTLNNASWLRSDFEVYCYLKSHLPNGYSIVAEPSTSYFSEWDFCYRVLDQHQSEIKMWSGSSRNIVPGQLMAEAQLLLESLRD